MTEPLTRRHDRTYLLEGVLLAVLVLGPSVAVGMALNADAGNIADWVAAVSTTLALGAAVVAARVAFQTLDRELMKDGRGQAEMVSAWAAAPMQWVADDVGHVEGQNDVSEADEFAVQVGGVDVRLRNASELPVTNVKLAVELILDHDAAPIPFAERRTIPVVPPGVSPQSVVVMADDPIARDQFVDLHTTVLNRVILRLRFTDAAGMEWLRTIPGELAPFERDVRPR